MLIQLFIFILPAYVANSLPVILGHGSPIDFGKNFFDGKRIFGPGKTIRGFIAAVVGGFFIGSVLGLLVFNTPYNIFNFQMSYVYSGILLGFGAIFGDLCGSFLKRRFNKKRGESLFFIDEIVFLLIALLFGSLIFYDLIFKINFIDILILIIITFVLHKIANVLAYILKLKNVPW
ncbi:MAG: CDP-2,3-bis-(O-geranylgeranyl)-sn-glycerol synthase [Candidatus Micrarchaeia archaeon]|jgi:CDP-2,3-bis-(O-geranylgeranyl)-sn-glycerol synthase